MARKDRMVTINGRIEGIQKISEGLNDNPDCYEIRLVVEVMDWEKAISIEKLRLGDAEIHQEG